MVSHCNRHQRISGAIDEVALGDQSVNAIDLLVTLGLFQRVKLHYFG